MTPLALLCEIIASGGKAAAAPYRGDQGFSALLCHGYLRHAGVLASVVCDDCDEPHAAPVLFEAGRYGYHCPEQGFVALDRADVLAVLPDLGHLTDRLSDAMACKRRKLTPVHGQTWRIGALETGSGEIALYFHPRLQSEYDARELEHALSREVRSPWRLIVTADGTLPVAWIAAVRLDELAILDAETGGLRITTQPGDLIGVPRKNKGGRPSEQGAALAEIISDRRKSGAAL